MSNKHCGYVAVVGRPSVGKSTLVNKLVGQKVSITSRRPQTTRHRIHGIIVSGDTQLVFVDTPGLHKDKPRAINRYMNRTALQAMDDVNAVVFMVEGTRWTEEDTAIVGYLARAKSPVLLVINKVDRVDQKGVLLSHIQQIAPKFDFAAVIPISAKTGVNLEALVAELVKRMPEAPWAFEEDQVTDRSERFLAAELVREKLVRSLGQELPYSTTVEIEQFEDKEGLAHISAVIWVEKDGQKAIVIGSKGEGLKRVGTQAREDMEKMLGRKVFLELWVRVKDNWSDDERAMRSLGYNDGS